MYYILNEQIALRAWRLVPHAYYSKYLPTARYLSKEEFEILQKCDGLTDIPFTKTLELLISKGFILSCQKGERTLTHWQKYRYCDNRYFPKLNWMITGKCNYNCLHCFNAVDNAPLQDEWALEDAIKLLDEAEICGIHAFTITGGEPMLHKHFLDIIKNIYLRGMYVEEINTNGFFVSQEILSEMKKIGATPIFKISFDCLGYHDWMRNRIGAEKETIRAITMCLENGFTVRVQTNLNRENSSSLYKTIDFLDKLGVQQTRIIRTTESPRWYKNAKDKTLGIDEFYDIILEFIKEYKKERRHMSINVWQFVTIDPLSRSFCLNPVICNKDEYRDTIPTCITNRGMIAISANGNVYPCHQISGVYDDMKISVENVKERGLQKVLQYGKYIDEVCYTVGELREENKECGECKYFRYCLGGCRAVALIYNKHNNGKDPTKCLFFKNGYYKKIITTLSDWKNLSVM